MSTVVQRIEDLIKRTPKAGYKASVYLGLLSKLASLADEVSTLAHYIECYGAAKESCKKRGGATLCVLKCGGLFAAKDGKMRIWKIGTNAFSAILSDGGVELRTERTRLVIEPGEIKVYLRAGESWEIVEADLRDQDDVYSKSYFIRYAIRDVGRSLAVAVSDIRSCARESAIAC